MLLDCVLVRLSESGKGRAGEYPSPPRWVSMFEGMKRSLCSIPRSR